MGYAGNYEPNYIIPTFISTAAAQVGAKKSEVADLDFFIGDEAMEKRANYNLDYPIRHGIIDNWDNMERYWQRCIYQYMRCDPEEHYMLLVRPVAQCFPACAGCFFCFTRIIHTHGMHQCASHISVAFSVLPCRPSRR